MGMDPTATGGISVAEYEKPLSYWVGQTIPALGKVTKFENGDYMVNDLTLKHWEFMDLVSNDQLVCTNDYSTRYYFSFSWVYFSRGYNSTTKRRTLYTLTGIAKF